MKLGLLLTDYYEFPHLIVQSCAIKIIKLMKNFSSKFVKSIYYL